jgi:tetratricopeptide (TPR) repeat protein
MSAGKTGRWARIFKQSLFLLITLTLFFGGLELILGLAGVHPLVSTEDPLVGFAGNSPLFVEEAVPGSQPVMKTAKNKLKLFNEQEFPRQKQNGAYRIFCMGGSTTFGRPYSDSTSFCGWLRVFLQTADPTRKWEVINAGGVSYASYRVARLMQELSQYQPDLFIVYSGQNEFLEERSYGKLKQLPKWLLHSDAQLSNTRVYTALKELIEYTGVIQQQSPQRTELRAEVNEILDHTAGPTTYERNDELKQQILNHYRINLGRMAKIARGADADIIYIKPVVNLKDMSPFKSEHKEGLNTKALYEWEKLYQHGNSQLDAGDPSAALETYRQALQIDDRYAELHYQMGKALFALGDFKAAEHAFWRAVDEDIAPLRMLSSMPAIIEETADWYDAPMVDFEKVLRKAYRRKYNYSVFGNEFFLDHVHPNIEGHRLLALELLQQLIDQDIVHPVDNWNNESIDRITAKVIAGLDKRAHAKALVTAGRVMDWGGKFDAAQHLFSQALEMTGPNGFVYGMLGKTAARNGHPEEAFEYFQKAIDIAPEMDWVQRDLAGMLARKGRITEAIEHYRKDLEMNPDNSFSHDRIAVLLATQGDEVTAEKHFKEALRANSDYGPAMLDYMVLLGKQEKYAQAEALGEKLLSVTTNNAIAHNNLGIIMVKQGKYEQAIAHFTEALRINPDFKGAGENLAEAKAIQERQ